jgi:hypothetical protein
MRLQEAMVDLVADESCGNAVDKLGLACSSMDQASGTVDTMPAALECESAQECEGICFATGAPVPYRILFPGRSWATVAPVRARALATTHAATTFAGRVGVRRV